MTKSRFDLMTDEELFSLFDDALTPSLLAYLREELDDQENCENCASNCPRYCDNCVRDSSLVDKWKPNSNEKED